MESFLSKRKRAEQIEVQKKMYETIAKVAIKYGPACLDGYTDSQISEFWKYDCDPPCREMFRKGIKTSDIKKVIQNAIRIDHDIWNADFLNGLAVNCELIKGN